MPHPPTTRELRVEKVRMKWYARMQVWLSACACISQAYFERFLNETRVYDSVYIDNNWMNEIIDSGSDVRCMNAFRMERHVLLNLCNDLEVNYGLHASRNMTVLEKVGIYLYIISLGMSSRAVSERFQRSGDTISRVFHQVLDALVGRGGGFNGLVRKLVQPRDKNFIHIPTKIATEDRYSFFKGAIGCIDGVHMECCIPEIDQFPYRGRKGFCSFNVMAVCDFDMFFTYISVGWEGSAHDTRVLDHSLNTPEMNFPYPPPGRYYLCDKGYPDRQGYMVPYSKVKYHQSQFHREAPQNIREGFNKVHTSLRKTIERCFKVLKKRWKMLKTMPSFSVSTQIDVTLHNYILEHRRNNISFEDDDIEEQVIFGPEDAGEDNYSSGISTLRDAIATQIWQNKRRYLGVM